MKFYIDEYLKSMYDQCIPKYQFDANSSEEFSLWQRKLRKAFIKDLGGFPKNRENSAAEIIESREYDDYTMQRIAYQSDNNLTIPAYVLIPKNKKNKLPAVIACHGHGYGSRDIVGLNPDGTDKKGDPGYQKNFAVELVKRGFLVIAPEIFGFGDRRLSQYEEKPLHESSCYQISTNILMFGKTVAGLRIYEIMRTVDYLLTRDDVDGKRIGCMGISGGGLVCAFSAAVDKRIKAAVVSGYTNTFKDSVMSIYHCVDNYIPAILKHAEMPEIIGLIAPRPLLIEAGTKDPIFPLYAVQDAYFRINKVYKCAGAENKLEQDIFEGDHQISGFKAYEWLLKWL